MPRGAGATYDHPYVRSCIKDILENELESGDLFDARTLSLLLSQYTGLSIRDKEKVYTLPEGTLMSSKGYFIRIARAINKESGNKLMKKHRTRKDIVLLCGRAVKGVYYYSKI